MINSLNHNDVLNKIKNIYKLEEHASKELIIYNIIRKLAVIHSPCSINLLKNKLKEQTDVLFNDLEIGYDLEEYIQDIVSYGDLLELSDVLVKNGNNYPKNTLFLSQNKFIRYSEKEFYLLGISNENEFPFNTDFEKLVTYSGPAKILTLENERDIETLKEKFGFSELPKEYWLNLPKEEIKDYYSFALKELKNSPNEITIENLEIFSHYNTNNYRKRKKLLENETGIFVCKKSHTFGSQMWGLIKTDNGKILNFIELPFKKNIKNNIRACDEAWRLNCAIDMENKFPQKYKILDDKLNKKWIQFFSPVPKWVERKLIIQGGEKRKSFNKSLYSISTSENNLKNDKLFLKFYLGMEEFLSGNN